MTWAINQMTLALLDLAGGTGNRVPIEPIGEIVGIGHIA